MSKLRILLIPIIAIALLTLFITPLIGAETNQVDWESKVDPILVQAYRTKNTNQHIEFIVRFEEQAKFDFSQNLTKEEKTSAVYEALRVTAENSQQELIDELDSLNLEIRPYAIINAIHVKGPLKLLPKIAQRNDVAFLHNNQKIRFDVQAKQSYPFYVSDSVNEIEWGVEKIAAPLVWAKGITGTGAIVAGQDTGYNWTHPGPDQSVSGMGQYDGRPQLQLA